MEPIKLAIAMGCVSLLIKIVGDLAGLVWMIKRDNKISDHNRKMLDIHSNYHNKDIMNLHSELTREAIFKKLNDHFNSNPEDFKLMINTERLKFKVHQLEMEKRLREMENGTTEDTH
jgi:hypothetical protein